MREHSRREPPQDYGDLVRLAGTLRRLAVREPGQQAIRDDLLAKLTMVPPSTMRGGRQAKLSSLGRR